MSRGQQPAVSAPSSTVVAPQADVTRAGAAADNSFDSVPTDYDVSDTSRSRSGEPVTTTSMDSSSSATEPRPTQTGSGCVSRSLLVVLGDWGGDSWKRRRRKPGYGQY